VTRFLPTDVGFLFGDVACPGRRRPLSMAEGEEVPYYEHRRWHRGRSAFSSSIEPFYNTDPAT